MQKKIDRLKNLNVSELTELCKVLFAGLGYTHVKQNEPGELVATIEGPVVDQRHGVLLVCEKLEISKWPYEDLKEKIIAFNKAIEGHSVVVVSTFPVSKSYQTKVTIPGIGPKFMDRNELIRQIDEHHVGFWDHGDAALSEYEKQYIESVTRDSQLKKLNLSDDRVARMLDIFIEPRISHMTEDPESGHLERRRVKIEDALKLNKPVVLSGDPGTGKTTLLKQVGKILIEQNKARKPKAKRWLPIFISVGDLIKTEGRIEEVIAQALSPFFSEEPDQLFLDYNLCLLIDSIDEFDPEKQEEIQTDLDSFVSRCSKCIYFLATRRIDMMFELPSDAAFELLRLENFNQKQTRRFVEQYFGGKDRAEDLMEALKENHILDRLPLTPLTLSLISILFERNQGEIPATMTGIYDSFSDLLLGRTTIREEFDFVDANFKERVLSHYAYTLLRRPENTPMTRKEFAEHFIEFYNRRSLSLDPNSFQGLLDFLVEESGVLYIQDEVFVEFKHDSFMEYFAAVEIFKHNRDQEIELIDNFFDISWQNAAVFYGGKSQDMPDFLSSIIEKAKTADDLVSFLAAVPGLGYLMQALYQTDNQIRKEGVQTALSLNLKAFDVIKKLAADEANTFFKKFNLPILMAFNFVHFTEHFHSITLRDPLLLAFEDCLADYNLHKDTSRGYKALKVAATLNRKRLADETSLWRMLKESRLLKDHQLAMMADLSIDLHEADRFRQFKKETDKAMENLSSPIRPILEQSMNQLRWTRQDRIRAENEVTLITEGKTDCEMIEHAFTVLSDDKFPYWTIKPCGNQSGGARELAKTLATAKPLIGKGKIVIGIFDNDGEGIQEFNGLDKNVFSPVDDSKRLKKHTSENIYALKLPIHRDRHHYIQPEYQHHNFFTIEHYFDDSFLELEGMLKDTPVDGVKKIVSSRKKSFSKRIRKIKDPETFRHFGHLLREIDRIVGRTDISYLL